jgi:hypothetical protein
MRSMQDRQYEPRLRTAVKGGLFGPPRRGRKAQIFVAGFGLLLVAGLAVPAFTDTVEPSPGMSVTNSGLLFMGFAELLDPRLHRLVVALRFVGAGIALFGLVLRLL